MDSRQRIGFRLFNSEFMRDEEEFMTLSESGLVGM